MSEILNLLSKSESELEINQELELYRLITENEYECGWTSPDIFTVWVGLNEIKEFVERLVKIFGIFIFDNSGVCAHIQQNSICIDLTPMLDECDINLSTTFPYEKFKH
jgi:hypothetical protein